MQLEKTSLFNSNFNSVIRDARIDTYEQQVNALAIVMGGDYQLAQEITAMRQLSNVEYAKTYFNRDMMAVSA
tara:strand:- start:574 stop:789 length:216 start_codon:yes stop_codon:yes gene_type:complete